jgi:AcrR family transcriptional regulator
MDDDAAQTRVLEAADRLFYAYGIRSVGMDQIRDASEVPLKRLYRLFPAKDQLVQAVLRRRDTAFERSLRDWVADRPNPQDKILGLFDYLYDWFSEPDFRGCPFINAFAEMSATSTGVTTVVETQKRALLALLFELVAAAKAPPAVAEQLFILANGAMVTSAILGSPEPARTAKDAALALLAAHQVKKAPRKPTHPSRS